ncbi:glycerate kinase [Tessaracoccus oleiagri]|uniref:Glycerate kinase n=1 Tax=Tessaracoccus oleiagri TaxID=686624 RepID=A0A1G9KYE3_9ACTN|nr:glycerate kinase [Tessaracoccus oleiagri]SDL54870.1 glycerate kinase [Tessaracoccus oleiagri]
MRVVVASDAIGGLDARTAAETIGAAFREEGAEVAVIVLAPDAPTPDTQARLAAALREGATVVDCTQLRVDDLGAGLLACYADTPRAGLDELRREIGGRALTVVVHGEELQAPLTGLSGTAVTSSREAGEDLAAGLAADARAVAWLRELGLSDVPGAGAAGGLGALFLACGARLADRLDIAMEATDFPRTAREADLVVTGCTELDFHAKGGALVSRVVEVAERALRPVIVVAGRNFVSSRELRMAGIESAYAVHFSADERPVTRDALADLAAKVAGTWRF